MPHAMFIKKQEQITRTASLKQWRVFSKSVKNPQTPISYATLVIDNDTPKTCINNSKLT